jgi:hypothetical protein
VKHQARPGDDADMRLKPESVKHKNVKISLATNFDRQPFTDLLFASNDRSNIRALFRRDIASRQSVKIDLQDVGIDKTNKPPTVAAAFIAPHGLPWDADIRR